MAENFQRMLLTLEAYLGTGGKERMEDQANGETDCNPNFTGALV